MVLLRLLDLFKLLSDSLGIPPDKKMNMGLHGWQKGRIPEGHSNR
jgi:hypothetical protein